jgi:hypothetical protein
MSAKQMFFSSRFESIGGSEKGMKLKTAGAGGDHIAVSNISRTSVFNPENNLGWGLGCTPSPFPNGHRRDSSRNVRASLNSWAMSQGTKRLQLDGERLGGSRVGQTDAPACKMSAGGAKIKKLSKRVSLNCLGFPRGYL